MKYLKLIDKNMNLRLFFIKYFIFTFSKTNKKKKNFIKIDVKLICQFINILNNSEIFVMF